MTIFDLAAKITLDTSEYEKGLGESKKSASKFGKTLKTAFKVGGAAIAAVTTATTAMTAALVKSTGQVAAYGDNIDKMSQKMGLSAEAYQEWDAIMQHSGTSIESLQASMKTLANAVEKGNKAFDRLGISQEEIASMNNEQLFSATITALQNVENETERTYLAGQLLGRGATELGALLNTSAEETEAMRKRVHELGGVMSNEAVKAAAAYQDSLQDMQTAFSGLSRGMISKFLPSITQVMDGLTNLFSGDTEGGLSLISSGITNLVNNITEKLPAFIDVGVKILKSIGTAIIDNLPQLASAATKIILQVVDFLIQSAPSLIDAALEILLALADGLIKNLPTLIPAIIDVMMTIVDKLTEPDTLAMLLVAAVQIIVALAEGIVDSIPKLLEKVPVILENLVSALKKAAPKLWEAAKELIEQLWKGIKNTFETVKGWGLKILNKIWAGFKENWAFVKTWGASLINRVVSGFSDAYSVVKEIGKNIVLRIWDGISGMASWLSDKVTGWAGDLVGGVADFLGIASPSKVFAEIGKYSAMGIGVGFDKEFDSVNKKIQEDMERLSQNDFNVSAGASWAYSSSFNSGHESSMNSATALNRVEATLNQILDRMGFDVVLDDGTLVGRIDKALGQAAMRKARGNT